MKKNIKRTNNNNNNNKTVRETVKEGKGERRQYRIDHNTITMNNESEIGKFLNFVEKIK